MKIVSYELIFNTKANLGELQSYYTADPNTIEEELEIQKTLTYTLLKKSFDDDEDVAICCLE